MSKNDSYLKRNIPKIIITAIILAVLIYVAFFWGNTEIRKRLSIEYEAQVKKYSQEYGLDEYFVYAIICAESSFRADAQSSVGAKGLMQMMPETAKWLKEKYKMDIDENDLFDPDTNIRLGCQYIKYLNGRFDNDITLVLAAYNGGEGNVRKWLKSSIYSPDGKTLTNIPYKETANYVKKVSTYYDLYKKIYQ